MKFEEKLIKLRREHGLSQEDLGEKLNVTRQTISKWELGETKPDSGKIMEIAKLFNVSTDSLLNEATDSMNSINDEQENKSQNNSKNNLLYILVCFLIICIICSGLFFVIDYIRKEKQAKKQQEEIMNMVTDTFDNSYDRINGMFDNTVDSTSQMVDEYELRQHNQYYEDYVGVQEKIFIEDIINRVIQDNSKGVNKVSIKFKNVVYSENIEIAELTSKLENNKKYLITCNYDENKYVNEIVIEEVENKDNTPQNVIDGASEVIDGLIDSIDI